MAGSLSIDTLLSSAATKHSRRRRRSSSSSSSSSFPTVVVFLVLVILFHATIASAQAVIDNFAGANSRRQVVRLPSDTTNYGQGTFTASAGRAIITFGFNGTGGDVQGVRLTYTMGGPLPMDWSGYEVVQLYILGTERTYPEGIESTMVVMTLTDGSGKSGLLETSFGDVTTGTLLNLPLVVSPRVDYTNIVFLTLDFLAPRAMLPSLQTTTLTLKQIALTNLPSPFPLPSF